MRKLPFLFEALRDYYTCTRLGSNSNQLKLGRGKWSWLRAVRVLHLFIAGLSTFFESNVWKDIRKSTSVKFDTRFFSPNSFQSTLSYSVFRNSISISLSQWLKSRPSISNHLDAVSAYWIKKNMIFERTKVIIKIVKIHFLIGMQKLFQYATELYRGCENQIPTYHLGGGMFKSSLVNFLCFGMLTPLDFR